MTAAQQTEKTPRGEGVFFGFFVVWGGVCSSRIRAPLWREYIEIERARRSPAGLPASFQGIRFAPLAPARIGIAPLSSTLTPSRNIAPP